MLPLSPKSGVLTPRLYKLRPWRLGQLFLYCLCLQAVAADWRIGRRIPVPVSPLTTRVPLAPPTPRVPRRGIPAL